jgi:hypothetical protein
VKRRIWPFKRPAHQIVLDRVEVQVICRSTSKRPPAQPKRSTSPSRCTRR